MRSFAASSFRLDIADTLDAPVRFAILPELNQAKLTKRIALIVVVANLALAAFVFLDTGTKPAPMPNPNGYYDLVKAGELLGDLEWPNQLKSYVSGNEPAFKLAETGLGRDCVVPNDYPATNMDQFIHDQLALKKLIEGIADRGDLAKLEGRTNDSVAFYLESIEASVKSVHGGVMFAKSFEIDAESPCQSRLESWTNLSDAQECRKILNALKAIENDEDSVSEIFRADRKRAPYGSIAAQAGELFSSKKVRELQENFNLKYQSNRFARRQLMVTFAARAYELEKGKRPSSLSDLVPSYLRAVPHDTVDGTNVIYRF